MTTTDPLAHISGSFKLYRDHSIIRIMGGGWVIQRYENGLPVSPPHLFASTLPGAQHIIDELIAAGVAR